MVGVNAPSGLPAPGSECLAFSSVFDGVVPAPSSLRFLSLSRATCARGAFQGGWVRDGRCHIVGSVEGFLLDPNRRTVSAIVVRWNGRSRQYLRVVPLMAVVARVDAIERTLNVEISVGTSLQAGDAFQPQHYAAFSDDDVLAALFGGLARD